MRASLITLICAHTPGIAPLSPDQVMQYSALPFLTPHPLGLPHLGHVLFFPLSSILLRLSGLATLKSNIIFHMYIALTTML